MLILDESTDMNPESFMSNPQDAYNEALEKLNLSRIKCPCCGSRGSLTRYSSYTRYFQADEQSDPILIEVTVFRCTCSNCAHPHHAFLPVWICPFCFLSYPFICEILAFFFGEANRKVLRTAIRFGITRSLVHSLLKHYEEDQLQALAHEIAKPHNSEPVRLIAWLAESAEHLKIVISEFLFKITRSFLTHQTRFQNKGWFLRFGSELS